ncbi:hypothetical protein EJ03DRAFT_122782 [Teratosphaeria nubilosa]|uniref:Uncharacterized protein n=1 Tax=Teratosphaeria nubilosa TaxID=161662 RepID=A0A6G1L5N3_9PEZI|nr:hypothetical protein EJ03DRAFT_122782 [Teratosphaeria nubilosa]
MSPETDALIKKWPWVSGTVGLALLVSLLFSEWTTARGRTSDLRSFNAWCLRLHDPRFWCYILGPMFMVDQFEEWGYDFKGRPYCFHKFLCARLGYQGDLTNCPGTPLPVFAVNAFTMWTAAWTLRSMDPAGAGANYYGMVVINSIGHLLPAVRDNEYNGGVVTTLIGFLPAAYFYYTAMLAQKRITTLGIVRSLVMGVVGHLLVLLPYMVIEREYIGEVPAAGVQILNTLMLHVVSAPV